MNSDAATASPPASTNPGSGNDQHSIPEMLAELHGQPQQVNARGLITLNMHFWAAFFAVQAGVSFNPVNNAFTAADPSSGHQRQLPPSTVMACLREFLVQIARNERYAYLANHLSQHRLEQMMKVLKTVAPTVEPDETTVLDNFLDERLEPHKGSDLTTRETWLAYQDYCVKAARSPMPENVFFKCLPDLVRQKFSATKRHDIKRDGKAQMGFVHMKLRS